jgi:uncharacterized membrane protein
MDKMGLTSIILVSVPEMILLILSIKATLGDRHNSKSTVFRYLAVILLTSALSVLTRAYTENIIINVILFYFVSVLIFATVLKLEWYDATVALVFSILVFGIIELATVGLIMAFSGLTTESIQGNDFTRIMLSLPVRLTELGFVYALNRLSVPLIEYGPLKFTAKCLKKLALLYILIFMCLIKLAITVKHYIFDINAVKRRLNSEYMVTDICFVSILVLFTLIIAFKFFRQIKFENKRTDNTLLLLKSLLESGESGNIKEDALEIINSAVNSK